MHRTLIALLVGAAVLAVPTASADACDGDPSAAAEVCTDEGQTGGSANVAEVEPTGCLVDVNGDCVPTGVDRDEGASVGDWRARTYTVGVDVNVACPAVDPCSYSYGTAALTYKAVELVV